MKWLGLAAFAAAFWITLRVVAAAPPPPPVVVEPGSAADVASFEEVRDPALERLIATMVSRSAAASQR